MDLGWPAPFGPSPEPPSQAVKKELNTMKRPFKSPGIGWIFAVVALVVALLGLVGVVVPVLSGVYVLIVLLALALLL
jgi:hypothetical protein